MSIMPHALQSLSDDQGTVVVGYLARGVFYVRLGGYVSSALGIELAARLRKNLADATGLACFFDVASNQGADFAARSAIARALLAHRSQVASVTTLVAPAPVPLRAKAVMTMLERSGQMMENAAAFRARLLEVAPFAASLLDSTRPARVRRSVRPAARSLRPRARSVTHA